MMNDRVQTTLKRKLLRLVLGVLSLVALSILGLVAWLNLQGERQTLKEIESQVRANIASKANSLAENQALALRGFVVDNAFTDVQKLVHTAVTRDPDVVYGVFVSTDGTPWAYTSPTTQRIVDDNEAASAISRRTSKNGANWAFPLAAGRAKSPARVWVANSGRKCSKYPAPSWMAKSSSV